MKQGGRGRQGGHGRPAAPSRLQGFSERSGSSLANLPSDRAAYRGTSGPRREPFRANSAAGPHTGHGPAEGTGDQKVASNVSMST